VDQDLGKKNTYCVGNCRLCWVNLPNVVRWTDWWRTSNKLCQPPISGFLILVSHIFEKVVGGTAIKLLIFLCSLLFFWVILPNVKIWSVVFLKFVLPHFANNYSPPPRQYYISRTMFRLLILTWRKYSPVDKYWIITGLGHFLHKNCLLIRSYFCSQAGSAPNLWRCNSPLPA